MKAKLNKPLSEPLSRTMDHSFHQDQIPLMPGVSAVSPGSTKDRRISTQDDTSLDLNTPNGYDDSRHLNRFWMSDDTLNNSSISSSKHESPRIPLSFPPQQQQFIASAVGQNDIFYQTGMNITTNDEYDLAANVPQDFPYYSPLLDLAFESDISPKDETRSYSDDSLSIGNIHPGDISPIVGTNETWNSAYGSAMDKLSSNIFKDIPASPPLTEAESEQSCATYCSSSGYTNPTTTGDDITYGGTTMPLPVSLGEPLFPVAPTLAENYTDRFASSSFSYIVGSVQI